MQATDLQTLKLAANTVRVLSAEGVEKAKSGHPGMPMGMAELAVGLWLKQMRYNSSDPKWLGRDRFVLSNGHGSMLLYSMLHLSGYAVELEDLKNFRQWDSITPGHPESYMTPGVETTTGPLGQGIGNAVGMAIAQQLMSARYGDDEFNPFNHKIFCFCGDGCLMEGVSSEASSIAGHLGLGNLTLIYDDNKITIAGHTHLAFTEDVGKRYESYGWCVQKIDGHDLSQIEKALAVAAKQTEKPNIIIASTKIGQGSPNKIDTHDVHGSPLGDAELKATKQNINWTSEEAFFVPGEVQKLFADRNEGLKLEYAQWQEDFSAWKTRNAEKAKLLEQQLALGSASDLEQKLIDALPKDGKAISTRKLSQIVLQAASANVPSLVGGSADLEPSTLTLINGSSDVLRGEFAGKNLRFGVREHGMGAIMNGLSYYGGFIPYGATFLCFLDYMRPTLRLAALSHLPGLFIYTHDSIFLGEDGPTHQPIEHLGILRITPNVWMFRPADGLETAIAYAQALERKDGPCALIFTRQNLEQLTRHSGFLNSDIRRGGYVVQECSGTPDVVMVASGSEVSLAVDAAQKMTDKKVRIVSMPCSQLFMKQDRSYRDQVIPRGSKKVVIEAASSFGWLEVVSGSVDDTLVIGIDRFGASAPQAVLAEKFGLTPDLVASRVSAWIA
jgi:transketolase